MTDFPITEYDRCPACKKKVMNLMKDRGGILRASCGAFVCKCGCHFLPKSMIDASLKQAQSPIVSLNDNDIKLVRNL